VNPNPAPATNELVDAVTRSPRPPERHHAGADDHGDAAELVSDLFTFTRNAHRADLDPQVPYRFGCGASAPDRGCGFSEARVETVTGGVELLATEPLQRSPHDRVMAGDQLLPSRIPDTTGYRA
jgi:hypothetical protein